MLGLSTSGTESVASVVAAWLAGVAAATVMFVLNRNSPCRPNHTIAVLRRAFTQITALSLAIALLNVPSLYAVSQVGGHPTGGVDTTTFARKYSWSYGWGRPVVAVVASFLLGTSASVHPSVRLLYGAFLTSELLLNGIAAMELSVRVECIGAGTCVDGTGGYYHSGLIWMYRRELGASAVEMWVLLDVLTVGLLMGFTRNRISQRQISVIHNDGERLHAELKKFADLDLEPLLPTMARPGNRAAASAAAGPSRSP